MPLARPYPSAPSYLVHSMALPSAAGSRPVTHPPSRVQSHRTEDAGGRGMLQKGGSPCWRQTKPPTQQPGGPCGLEACHRTGGFRSPDAQRAVVHVARWWLGTGTQGGRWGLMVRKVDDGVVDKRPGHCSEWLDCLLSVCRWSLSRHHPCLFFV